MSQAVHSMSLQDMIACKHFATGARSEVCTYVENLDCYMRVALY